MKSSITARSFADSILSRGRSSSPRKAITSRPTSTSSKWTASTKSFSTRTGCLNFVSAPCIGACSKTNPDENQATREYVKDKLRSALWLIKSVDQRQKTIYKVANSIVRQQHEFLDNGVEQLRPLVLRDVAIDIGMHESTVSRVVANKYIHTPQGVCPMKYFFHSGNCEHRRGSMSRQLRSNNASRKLWKRRTPRNLSPIPKSSKSSKMKGSFSLDARSRNIGKSCESLPRISGKTYTAARSRRERARRRARSRYPLFHSYPRSVPC